MENIWVSVIIPVYKIEKYLNQCVDSILKQTYHELEVILVDDRSSDKCPQICDIYAEKDKRVKVIHQENAGLSAARNSGIESANGDYIIFLDGDDFFDDTEAIERLVKRVKTTKADVLNYSYKKYYEDTGDKVPQFNELPPMPV